MIEIDVVQGSEEWFEARLGCITASEASKIITAQGSPSRQFDLLRNQLIAELWTNKPTAFTSSDWMKRGKDLEPEARAAAAVLLDREILPAGFCYESDARLVGCSPDGRFGGPGDYTAGGLELKCPAAHTQIEYLWWNVLPEEYRPQVQFSMMVTGALVWHFVSYHPDLPPLHVKVPRNKEYIAVLKTLTIQLQAKISDAIGRLRSNGYAPIDEVPA